MIAHSDLVWDPPSVEIANLKPGETQSKTITLTNANDVPVIVSGTLHARGDLFSGAYPLDVSFVVAPGGSCAANPEILMPNTSTAATVSAELPASAGNEYQNLTGGATYIVTAEQSVCPSRGGGENHLPQTGAATSGGEGLILLVAAGLALIYRKRLRLRAKNETQEAR